MILDRGRKFGRLGHAEASALRCKVVGGDAGARAELIERSIPLAISFASRMSRDRPHLFDEIQSECFLAIVEVVDHWDPAKWPMSVALKYRLLGRATLVAVRSRVPVEIPKNLATFAAETRCGDGAQGSARSWIEAERCHPDCVGLLPGGGDDGIDAVDDGDEFRCMVQPLFEFLDDRQSEVVRLYFGLDRGEGRNFREVGLILGVTRQRVQQILDRALTKMKAGAERQGLDADPRPKQDREDASWSPRAAS